MRPPLREDVITKVEKNVPIDAFIASYLQFLVQGDIRVDALSTGIQKMPRLLGQRTTAEQANEPMLLRAHPCQFRSRYLFDLRFGICAILGDLHARFFAGDSSCRSERQGEGHVPTRLPIFIADELDDHRLSHLFQPIDYLVRNGLCRCLGDDDDHRGIRIGGE